MIINVLGEITVALTMKANDRIIRKTILSFLLCFSVFLILDSLDISVIFTKNSILVMKVMKSLFRICTGVMCIFCAIKVLHIETLGIKKLNFFKGLRIGWPLIATALIIAIVNSTPIPREMTLVQVVVRFLVCSFYTFSVGFFEECLCRGMLLNGFLKRWKFEKAIIISSATFGIFHLTNLVGGADFFSTIIQVCYTTIGGIIYSVTYLKSGNLWSVITLHGLIDLAVYFTVFVSL
ncbi:MAG: hypothetical protein K0S47_3116 [Herbinix sp.]|jgi:membrane protease YdiL (CAAX protease family)|nr:hypothetical protein [Herbinix sp.]